MSEGSEVVGGGGCECTPALESARLLEPGHTQGPDAVLEYLGSRPWTLHPFRSLFLQAQLSSSSFLVAWASLAAQLVKNPPAVWETWV